MLPVAELEKLERLRATVESERSSPHRIRDLAIDGDDLISIGYAPGPAIGKTLTALLDEVVRTPELNTREVLLSRAKELRE